MSLRSVREEREKKKTEKPKDEKGGEEVKDKKPVKEKAKVKEEAKPEVKKSTESIGLVGDGEIATNFRKYCREKGYGISTVLRRVCVAFTEGKIPI